MESGLGAAAFLHDAAGLLHFRWYMLDDADGQETGRCCRALTPKGTPKAKVVDAAE